VKKQSAAKTFNAVKKKFETIRPKLSKEAELIILTLIELFEIVWMAVGRKNSSKTSSTPPSEDKNRDKKSKKKTGRKKGGQKGHPGSGLGHTPNPDRIEQIKADHCDSCGKSLEGLPGKIDIHQVVDIEFTKVVTEYQIEIKNCPCGNHQNDHLCKPPVTYGPVVKAKAVELQQIHCLALLRCALFFQKNFNITLSPATIQAFSKKAFRIVGVLC
jgi:transposase